MRRVLGNKLLVGTLAATMLFPISVNAAEIKEWTIGYEENKKGPVDEKQGENGWYFLYGEEINTEGKLDSEKLKECVWSDSGSCWMYYGVEAMWMPEKYAAEDYDCDENKNWWRMDSNGIMNTGCDDYRMAIAWEAPQSGTYSVNVEYTAGTDSYEWEGITYYQEEGDGLTLSINSEKEILDKEFCKAVTEKEPDLSEGRLSAQIELEKGERIYLSSDPGENADGDSVRLKAKILQLEAAGEAEEEGNEKPETAGSFEMNENLMIAGIGVLGILIGFASVLIRAKRERL